MKRGAVDELRSEEVTRLSPLGRLRADSHEIEEESQTDIHRAIDLPDEPPPRSRDKEEVLTPMKNTDDDCSSLFDSQSPDVLEGVCDRLWWHSNTWQHLEEQREDWLSNQQSFKPATANDLMSSLNPHLCKFCRIFFDYVWKVIFYNVYTSLVINLFNLQLISICPLQFANEVSRREPFSTLFHLNRCLIGFY